MGLKPGANNDGTSRPNQPQITPPTLDLSGGVVC